MKKSCGKVDFLHADKRQCSLPLEAISFGGCYLACFGMPKVHRIRNLQFIRSSVLGFRDLLSVNVPPTEL